MSHCRKNRAGGFARLIAVLSWAILLGPCAVQAFAAEPGAVQAPAAAGDPAPPVTGAPAAPETPPGLIRGRLLDGAAMARSFNPQAAGHAALGDPLAGLARVPLAAKKFRLHLIDGPGRGKTWEGTSDGEGRFEISLGGLTPPPGRCLVASVDAEKPLFSPAMAPAKGETEFRVYTTSEDDRLVRGELNVYHSFQKDPSSGRKELEILIQLVIQNSGTSMYVGHRSPDGGVGGMAREVFRVPVPSAARLDMNHGSAGLGWTEFPRQGAWRWMVVDSPVPPQIEEPRSFSIWELRFRMEPRQESLILYPVGLNLEQFAAWTAGEEISIDSPQLMGKGHERQADPSRPGQGPQEWNVAFSRGVAPGESVALEVRIDNAALGEVNRGSLLLLGGFILAGAGAIAVGLLLGRKGTSMDGVLEEAAGDEIIARIAALDARHERREIPEAEYRKLREKLLDMARYSVSELGGPSAEGPAAGAGGMAIAPQVRQLVERLRDLEGEGPADARKIQERLLILEEIAKVLLAPSKGGRPSAEGPSAEGPRR